MAANAPPLSAPPLQLRRLNAARLIYGSPSDDWMAFRMDPAVKTAMIWMLTMDCLYHM